MVRVIEYNRVSLGGVQRERHAVANKNRYTVSGLRFHNHASFFLITLMIAIWRI